MLEAIKYLKSLIFIHNCPHESDKMTETELGPEKRINRLTFLLLATAGINWSWTNVEAAIPAKDKSIYGNWIVQRGSAHGGVAGVGFSLLDLQLIQPKNQNAERFVFDVGDQFGNALKKKPGYYNAELRENKLLLDFSQMLTGKISEKTILQKIKNSKFVRAAVLTADTADKSLNLTFTLKDHTRVRVLQVEGVKATSRVVVDFASE